MDNFTASKNLKYHIYKFNVHCTEEQFDKINNLIQELQKKDEGNFYYLYMKSNKHNL